MSIAAYTRRPLYLRGSGGKGASYWRGSRSAASVPENAILTEAGAAITTEFGEFIVTET